MMNPVITTILDGLKNDINQLLGFHEDTPRINYGPCGVFAQLFFESWNRRFKDKAHICFVMTRDREECWHIVIRLPAGELYDGGIGAHADSIYTEDYLIDEMFTYDHDLLEKWSYGLERTYPRFCPNFDKNRVREIIDQHLDRLSAIMVSAPGNNGQTQGVT